MAGVDAARAGAVLTVDLDAIRGNYRLLRATAAGVGAGVGATAAAVMKADAYGLGMEMVAPALALEGCRVFFTAHLEEGMRLRALVPPESTIYVLHGAPPGTSADCLEYDLIPVLNDPGQVAHHEHRTNAVEGLRIGAQAVGIKRGQAHARHPRVELDRGRQHAVQLAGAGAPLRDLRGVVQYRGQAVLDEVRGGAGHAAVQDVDRAVQRHQGAQAYRFVEVGGEEHAAALARERGCDPVHAQAVGVGLHHAGAGGRISINCRAFSQQPPVGADGVQVDRQHGARGGCLQNPVHAAHARASDGRAAAGWLPA